MKTTLADIIPKMFRYSEKLDNNTSLMKSAWIMVDENKSLTIKYIFRPEKILLISENGKVKKGKWEYLGDSSILIEKEDENFLFNHAFLDEKLLVLKLDSDNKYFVLVNEKLIDQDIDSHEKVISYIQSNYDLSIERGELKAKKILKKEVKVINKPPQKIVCRIELTNCDILEVYSNKEYQNGMLPSDLKGKNVTVNGEFPEDGIYKSEIYFDSQINTSNYSSNRKIFVKDGKIEGVVFYEK